MRRPNLVSEKLLIIFRFLEGEGQTVFELGQFCVKRAISARNEGAVNEPKHPDRLAPRLSLCLFSYIKWERLKSEKLIRPPLV